MVVSELVDSVAEFRFTPRSMKPMEEETSVSRLRVAAAEPEVSVLVLEPVSVLALSAKVAGAADGHSNITNSITPTPSAKLRKILFFLTSIMTFSRYGFIITHLAGFSQAFWRFLWAVLRAEYDWRSAGYVWRSAEYARRSSWKARMPTSTPAESIRMSRSSQLRPGTKIWWISSEMA